MTHDGPDPWTTLADVAPGALADPLLELHWAVQPLAGAGQTFAAPKPDDSHRSLTWDDDLGGFLGEEFAGGYPFRVGLSVADLTLHLRDRTPATLGSLSLPGNTMEDAYTWMRTGLSQYMGGTGPIVEQPDFAIPDHPVGEGGRFRDDRTAERAALAALYRSAASLLSDFVAGRDDASAVRCWPHHFDIATLLTLREAQGDEAARTVGVGMAPVGGGFDSWYWYVSPWPYPAAASLPAIKGPARWHTEGWTGVVLEGEKIVGAPAEARRALVADYVEEAVRASGAALDIPQA